VPVAGASAATPARALARLERLLLETDSLSLTYDVRSTGAAEARLSGQLFREGSTLALRAAGHLGEEKVNAALLEEAGDLELTAADSTRVVPAPASTWEAMALGLTRMGVLHNLTRLAEGKLPDRAHEGIGGWLRAGEVRAEEGDVPGGVNIVFEVVVDGEVRGEATLVLGSGGLPVERRQRVDFGEATMEVLERYTWIRVPVEPGTAETYSF
jgi:hypothetical protein